MFGVFVSSVIFVFVGGPAGYVLWQHMQDRKFQEQALDYDSYSVPIPWGVADGFSQGKSAKFALPEPNTESSISLSPHQVQECIRYQLNPGIYAMAIQGLPDDEPIPHPSELVTWDIPTSATNAHPPTQPPTPKTTPKPTPNQTGVTHGTTANQVVQPFQQTDSTVVQGVVHEPIQPDGSEETERIILECGPYKLDPDNELSVEAVEMALSIGRSQNWILKNVFPGVSKGGNSDYQTFKQIVEKANV